MQFSLNSNAIYALLVFIRSFFFAFKEQETNFSNAQFGLKEYHTEVRSEWSFLNIKLCLARRHRRCVAQQRILGSFGKLLPARSVISFISFWGVLIEKTNIGFQGRLTPLFNLITV